MPKPQTSSATKALVKNRAIVGFVATGLMIVIFFLSMGSDTDYSSLIRTSTSSLDSSSASSVFKTGKGYDDDEEDQQDPSGHQQHNHHHHETGDSHHASNTAPSQPSSSTGQQQQQSSSSSGVNNNDRKNIAILLTRTRAECDAASELSRLSSVPFRHWIIVGLQDFDCNGIVQPITDSSVKRIDVIRVNCVGKGISTCVNAALSKSSISSYINNNNNNKKIDWVFLMNSWPSGIEKKALRNLMMMAAVDGSSQQEQVGIVQTSDYNNAAMLLHFSKLLEANVATVVVKDNNNNNNNNHVVSVKLFDENMVSQQGDIFCTECTDLIWRANLQAQLQQQQLQRNSKLESNNNTNNNNNSSSSASALNNMMVLINTRRKIIREALLSEISTKFQQTPRYFIHNMDYLMQKWGHAFQYELVLPHPPSNYLHPFNESSISLASWELDPQRQSCIVAKANTFDSNQWCWYDFPATSPKLMINKSPPSSSSDNNNNIDSSSSSPNKVKPSIRPSFWYKRDVATQKITANTQLPPLSANPKEESAENLPEWLKAIKQALIRGQHSTSSSEETLPALVSLLYTDCDFQRTMLGSIKTPLKRLIIAWNGHDSCAQQTVAYLRYHVPASSFAVVFFPTNRGFAAGFNAGFQLALAEAARHNEEPPKWAIVSNGDIKYDHTLVNFVKFSNREMSKEHTDAAFFFGAGVSFCTVGTSLLVVERAGFLDENFFPSYNEDIDYMWRGHLVGLQNKHEFGYKFDHRNGGSYHGKNRTLVDLYISRFTRGNTKEFCHAKWGDCDGGKVWAHLPPSGWKTPFKAIGIPSSYWVHDHHRIDCINGLGGPTYVGDSACWYDGTTMLDDFPDAILPQHIVAPPRKLASKDVIGQPIVYAEVTSEVPDAERLLASPSSMISSQSTSSSSSPSILAILGVFSSASYSNFKSLIRELGARHRFTTQLLVGVQSVSKNNNNKNIKNSGIPNDQLRTQLERSHPLQVSIGALSGNGIANSLNVGLAKIYKMNKFLKAKKKQLQTDNNADSTPNNNKNDWVLIFAESRSVNTVAIEHLVLEANKVIQEQDEALKNAKSEIEKKKLLEAASSSLIVVSDEYNLVVFVAHLSVFDRIGTFDENFVSQPDDRAHMFCGECVDFWWRNQLYHDQNHHHAASFFKRRRVTFHARIVPFARRWYPTPSWFVGNLDETCLASSVSSKNQQQLPVYDYLTQKWGQTFQHQFTQERPPSGWTHPFNCTSVDVSDWRPAQMMVNSKNGDHHAKSSSCWINVIKTYDVKNPLVDFDSALSKMLYSSSSASSSTSSSSASSIFSSPHRPSQFLLRFLENNPVEEEMNLVSSSTEKLLQQYGAAHFNAKQDTNKEELHKELLKRHESWLPNIVNRISEGHVDVIENQNQQQEQQNHHQNTNTPNSAITTSFSLLSKKKPVIPAFVAITYTDCDYLRKMLGTVNVAVHRLHIIWSGDDETSCAETMFALRTMISDTKFLQIVHLSDSRGVAGAYNAGWRSALSSASYFNEPIPKYVFFSHADITYDDTFPKFIDFIDTEFANHEPRVSDSGFFFSGATSLCSVGISTNTIDRAGFFDENFYPWGFQDNDFIWRVHMAGMENKHDMRYRITHVNGGAQRGSNHRILKQYNTERRRADTIQYCAAKWGDCEGFKVWEHYPPSNFRSPFNASGVPFYYWKLDEKRRDCIIAGGMKKIIDSDTTGDAENNNNNNKKSSSSPTKIRYRYSNLQMDSSLKSAQLSTFTFYAGTGTCTYSGNNIIILDQQHQTSSSLAYSSAILPKHVLIAGKNNIKPPTLDITPAAKDSRAKFEKESFDHLKIKVAGLDGNSNNNGLTIKANDWSQETLTSMFSSDDSSSSSTSPKIVLLSHIPSDPLCQQIKMIPKIAKELQNYHINRNNNDNKNRLDFDRYMISSSKSSSSSISPTAKCSSRILSNMQANMKHFGVVLEDDDTNDKNTHHSSSNQQHHHKQNHESISKVLNKAYEQYKKLISLERKPASNNNNNNDHFWFVVVMKWNNLIPSSIVKLLDYIDSNGQHLPPPIAYSETLDKNVGMIIGSDFEFGNVFAISSKVFETAGMLDENLNSLEGSGNFCLECVDIAWRMELLRRSSNNNNNNLRRKVLPFHLVSHQKAFVATPFWYQDNADYFMQKWGHAFQYELNLPKPPSGWTKPFNLLTTTTDSDVSLLTTWKIDEDHRLCMEETPVSEKPFCWFDVVKTYSSSSSSTNENNNNNLDDANKQRPVIRPSWWFLRHTAPTNGSPLPAVSPKLLQSKEEAAKGGAGAVPPLPEWLTSISKSLQKGRDMIYDSTNATSYSRTLPAMISLLYTDCDLQRSMMGSIQTPLKRLIIAWNGDDSCAAETVSYLRLYAPKNSVGYVFYPSNKGFSAAFNAGWRVAVADAAKNDEEPPKWAIVSNGDIKYDKTLFTFVKLAGTEVSHQDSDACFFFGPGVSFCTVGMSLETIHRAGFLDENFFPSYNEDIDYMWRAHLNGMSNKHEMTYKFDHVNGGTYRGKNQKLVSSYVARFHRGNTKEQCHSKWHDCEGVKVWLPTPPTGWIHPYNSTGLPYSYWKLDTNRWRCINKDTDANKEKNYFYQKSEVCWYNTSVMLEDFPDFVPAEHARWDSLPILPSIRFKRRNS